MQGQATARGGAPAGEVVELGRETVVQRAAGEVKDEATPRRVRQERALRSALWKRGAGVPTYTVPEAAALLSVSQEHLYRLIHAGAFPTVPMRPGLERGKFVVAAAAVEERLRSGRDSEDTGATVPGRAAGGVS